MTESDHTDDESSRITIIEPDDNPWGVRLLDVRPLTQTIFSTSQDKECAENAVSFRQEDGRVFLEQLPLSARPIEGALQYRVAPCLAEGVLYSPTEMEHKWALFYHDGCLLGVRSWTRKVVFVAEVHDLDGGVEVTGLRWDNDRDDDFVLRSLDYVLRSHVLHMRWPAPAPAAIDSPEDIALWCFSSYGRHAEFATSERIPPTLPDAPLRSQSMLHISAARGDHAAVEREIARGTPLDLPAPDGLTPLHWAMACADRTIAELLLNRGAPIDSRSTEGATPLMNAAQSQSQDELVFLLERGADAGAGDSRGFTALHRAAEMGEAELVHLLVDHGAAPHPEAEGHTPRSLAEQRGHTEIVAYLDSVR